LSTNRCSPAALLPITRTFSPLVKKPAFDGLSLLLDKQQLSGIHQAALRKVEAA
jgi:hypothetical protein